ncbi:hypothetical protein [Larkinella punicea]|uniref:Secretion system C-terminal sorting domain-containing protein n=1 Tax=Larkinella punicea TaxID=2315727 RepID=A0A368JDU1_9BACT|nr:hypothetical protein [Larkinella punicea]RCR65839.1 hypothetical protein DUE52_29655 [Larkinella punicea]
MKTLIKSLLVAFTLTLITVSASLAETHKPIGRPKNVASFKSSIYTTREGKVQIALNKETGGSVMVRLTNKAGAEFFVQQFGKRHQASRLRLDVSALPDGIYTVSITNGLETTTYGLTLGTQQQAGPVSRLVAFN